ncbi:hypothetical protein GCM10017044_00460 [Kordiimonas sediminis]|uniref:histidine kinase n=1 Tax=Kordiimonas sediminis TaxID=1735581 RepID=A0A919E3Q7_9PROT|nr:ATP-binding protein [Kordiimonas sediminis]GHF10689.1 hypothetical protein GCM10017044_00460 [Kordiimonas sediminis]
MTDERLKYDLESLPFWKKLFLTLTGVVAQILVLTFFPIALLLYMSSGTFRDLGDIGDRFYSVIEETGTKQVVLFHGISDLENEISDYSEKLDQIRNGYYALLWPTDTAADSVAMPDGYSLVKRANNLVGMADYLEKEFIAAGLLDPASKAFVFTQIRYDLWPSVVQSIAQVEKLAATATEGHAEMAMVVSKGGRDEARQYFLSKELPRLEALNTAINASIKSVSEVKDLGLSVLGDQLHASLTMRKREAEKVFRASVFQWQLVASVLLIIVTYFTYFRLAKPLHLLIMTTRKMVRGQDVKVDNYLKRSDEIGSLARALSIFRSYLQKRNEAEKALEQEKQKFSRILELMGEAVVAIDKDHKVCIFNRHAEEVFGYAAKDIIGQNINILLPEQFRAMHHQQVNSFDKGGQQTRLMNGRANIQGRRSNGEIFQAAGSIAKVDFGEQTLFTAALRDISYEKEQEAALLAERARAELASRAKSEFLANMSHELRTPLNAIIGFSDIMQNELMGTMGSPVYKDYTRDIHQSGQHLLSIINNILDISKIEAGRYEVQETLLAPEDVCDAAMRLVRYRADSKNIKMSQTLELETKYLRGGETELKQMLSNLLSNAVKFTEENGSVTLSGYIEGDTLVFAVTDTGIGISLENLEKITEPFWQVDNSLQRHHEGTGLGLALVKQLMEQHQGTLQIESKVGIGTTTYLRFPKERIIDRATLKEQPDAMKELEDALYI